MDTLKELTLTEENGAYRLTGTFHKEQEAQMYGDDYEPYYTKTLAELPLYTQIRTLAERYERTSKTAVLFDFVSQSSSVPLVESFAKMRRV